MRKFTQMGRQLLPALITIIFGYAGVHAQVGQTLWQYSNPKPFGFNVSATSFIDNNNGLMVGDAGGIAKTNDGGVTWGYFGWYTFGNNGAIVKPTFNEVQMVTASLAFASGTNGVLLKSIDGGINWSRVATPLDSSGVEITSFSFLNANVGWLCGEPIGGNTSSGITSLYKTTDGGATWTLESNLPNLPAVRLGNGSSTPFYYDSSRAKSLYRIRMVRDDLGYVSGAAGLLWKYDGTGWKNYSPTNFAMGLDTLASATRPVTGPQAQSYRGLIVVKDSVVVMGSQSNGVIIRVNTAEAEALPVLVNYGNNVVLVPGLNGLTVTQLWNGVKAPDGKLAFVRGNTNSVGAGYLLSSDEGWTWQYGNAYPLGSGYEAFDMRAIAITPSKRYVLGGAFGALADSLNGTWRRPYVNAKPGAGFNKVGFPDAAHGATVGGFGTIVTTSDGGANWVDRTNANDAAALVSYYAMDYYKPDSFYLATNSGLVKVSFDGGATFDQLFQDSLKLRSNSSSPVFYGMDWLNSQLGWVSSYRGDNPPTGQQNLSQSVIFYTKDGGFTWDSSFLPSGPWPIINNVRQNYTPQIRDIKFANEQVGYAAGTRASIWKTIDGGANWSRIFQGADSASFSGTFTSLALLDENNVYAVGNGSKAYRTNDGGATWMDAKGNLPSANLNGVAAYDSLQAFVFMNSGLIWYTADGGNIWGVHSAPVPVGAGNGILTDGAFASINPGCGQPVCNTLWVVGTGGVILKFGSDRVLPVKISPLTGTATNEGNMLFWTAYQQENTKYFELEFAADGVNYKPVSEQIFPLGYGTQSYTWQHKNAPVGKAYYRLKAVELSGSVTYTNIVILSTRTAPKWGYFVANGTIGINNASALQGKVAVRVMNAAGQTIAAKEYMHPGGAFNDYVILPQQAKGIHFVQVVNEGTATTFKVILE